MYSGHTSVTLLSITLTPILHDVVSLYFSLWRDFKYFTNFVTNIFHVSENY